MELLLASLPHIAITLVVVIILAWFFWPEKNKRYPPIAGTILHQLKHGRTLHHYHTELARKYTTYRMVDIFNYGVYTSDPANVEHVLKTNFANYGKGSYVYDLLNDSMGDGIFGVDGEKWRHQRKSSSAQFSTKVLREFSSDMIKYTAVKLCGIIHEAATSDKSIEIQVKRRDFISKLMEAKNTDPKYLRDMVLSFIAAGKDTTASALSWFIYMMCMNHDVQEKIAKEIREVTNLNDSSNPDEVAANLTETALSKLQYLHASLNETLRLYPTVPLGGRVCFADDTLPDGYSVRKGELVVYQPYSMGRMKYIWGDDAEEFKPERWFDENGNLKEESPFKFIAFNAGPRTCLGRDYSYLQMKIFAALLLNNFTFKLADEKKVVKYRTMVTLHINKGLHVRAFPRA